MTCRDPSRHVGGCRDKTQWLRCLKLELTQLRQRDPALCHLHVIRISFDTDEVSAEQCARDTGGTAPHEWVENGITGFREKFDAPLHDFQCFLCRVRDERLLGVFEESRGGGS